MCRFAVCGNRRDSSGYTGIPKGVEIEHAGLANFVEWQNGFFPHAKLHRTTQAARPGFDASCSGLNAAAFIPNPANPEERLYRSGDIGIRNPDGRFQFVGRKDFQIKLRGQRLELGEIEEVIASHPDVAKCVASVRDSASGSKSIVAYVTLHKHSQ